MIDPKLRIDFGSRIDCSVLIASNDLFAFGSSHPLSVSTPFLFLCGLLSFRDCFVYVEGEWLLILGVSETFEIAGVSGVCDQRQRDCENTRSSEFPVFVPPKGVRDDREASRKADVEDRDFCRSC
jgi:hypothetical protein